MQKNNIINKLDVKKIYAVYYMNFALTLLIY